MSNSTVDGCSILDCPHMLDDGNCAHTLDNAPDDCPLNESEPANKRLRGSDENNNSRFTDL